MANRVILHVGLPKSGTTYIQAVLGKNKEQLKKQAKLLYPGASWGSQVRAVRDVRQMKVTAGQARKMKGAWSSLVEEMLAWDGTSIVSMEWLCAAEKRHIVKIARDLESAQVEVLFTARDLGRTIPAAWQEFMQNRQSWPWDKYLKAVVSENERSAPGRAFWSQQHLERLVGNWSAVMSPERVHVVTVPHPGAPPSVLWERLCAVLGIDPQGYAVADVGSNESLGLESAELMRRLNPVIRASGMPSAVYGEVFKRGMAKGGLSQRKGDESRLGVPVQHHDWLRARADRQIRTLESSPVRVVGDLEDLRPVLDPARSVQPDQVGTEAVLEAALHGLVAVATQRTAEVKRIRREAAALKSEVETLRRELEQQKSTT